MTPGQEEAAARKLCELKGVEPNAATIDDALYEIRCSLRVQAAIDFGLAQVGAESKMTACSYGDTASPMRRIAVWQGQKRVYLVVPVGADGDLVEAIINKLNAG